MNTADGRSVPDWPDALLRNVIDTNFGLGAESDLPDNLRFLLGVVRVTKNRLREWAREKSETQANSPAVFFYAPALPAQIDVGAVREVPMLDTGRATIGGRFWFVGPTAARGFELKPEAWPEDAEMFSQATENLAMGDVPAVVVELRTETPQVRHYRRGLANPEDVEVVSLESETIDIERILAAVDQAHKMHLATPQPAADMQLWTNRAKHWPARNAERRIQFILRVALQGAFPMTVVREEQPQPAGRLDIEIEELQGEGVTIKHALLELKVLRSYGSTGKSVGESAVSEAIMEGVNQAVSYKKESGVHAAALCCFDMRTAVAGAACFTSVRNKAKRHGVRLRSWHIFASTKEFREATYGK
jgi:hypothetical protein